MPNPTPLTSHTTTFRVAPASGSVELYWWRVHDDATGQLIWQQSSPYWQTELLQHQVGDEPFFLSAQAWGATLDDHGRIGAFSDVYQFTTPVPEPGSAFLLAGLVVLALMERRR